MMRWWWFGPSVEREELDRELREMAAAGFGGVEVAFVYPLGPVTADFGSDRFLADVRFAAERARDHGLRFDLTLGSGWSFGGPHVSADLAARRLRWDRREIGSGPMDIPVVSPWPDDELVAAYVGDGSAQERPDHVEQLPIEDGVIKIPDRSGPRLVLLAYAGRTGQNVKRAAAGAAGPVFDHYSAAATRRHLQAVGDRLLDAVPAELVGSVFCDSLEVYGADWTPELPAEFARRCGYELLPQLQLLITDGAGAHRLRADYHRTLSRLYEENFVAVIQRWAAARGVPFRLQGYGTPPAVISSYRFADLFEGEGWGWQEITQTRWASSAAHLYGRRVVSSEVWTWVHSPSFRATPVDLLGEAHEHFLNGVNQLVGHGWPYSPAGAAGVGWIFYAAGAINERNPWWPAMSELNAYLTRLSWLLQQGEPVAEVAIYVSDDDLFAGMGTAVGGSLDAWREANRRIPPEIPATVRTAGLDYDLVDDDALTQIAPDRYRTVIMPSVTSVPDATGRWLGDVLTAGGSVITIDSRIQLAGATEVHLEDLATVLGVSLVPDLQLDPPVAAVGCVHRRYGDRDGYLLVNTGPETTTFRVRGRRGAGRAEIWNAYTGECTSTSGDLEDLDLTLHPYQATVIMSGGPSSGPDAEVGGVARITNRRRVPAGQWQVEFPGDSPRSVELPHIWELDPRRRHHSGQATYSTVVDVGDDALEAVIDFGDGEAERLDGAVSRGMVGPSYRARLRGPIGEVAQIRVNGREVGLIWAPPYRCDISGALRPGKNDIAITVYNTAANALAADREIVRLASESEQRHGRRFRLQDLDRAMATVRSGLLREPVIEVGSHAP